MLAGFERIVFPLDVPTLTEAERFIGLLRGHVGVFKVGLELFSAVGPDAVRAVRDAGSRCFLDLKLNDIPATVAGAVRSARALRVEYLSVHALSGREALHAAAGEAGETRLLAVTMLTSLGEADLQSLGLLGSVPEAVHRLADLALRAGVSGFVCSTEECAQLRTVVGSQGLLVVPGIRPLGSGSGDQKRVASPAHAISQGADLLVVGRPIRHAVDPVAAADAVAREIEQAISP